MIPRTVMVPVGEARVSSDPGEVLATCVGSCVAVVLFDRRTGTAGLLHAVLPERHSFGAQDYPDEYFADPGVRVLLGELLRRGASRDGLSATVVGGASLLSNGASAESVGARNAVKALELLREEGIPAAGKDLGGHHGRRVEVRVATGEVEVHLASRSDLPADRPRPASAPGVPAELAARMSSLGPNPAAAGALLDAVHRPSIDWDEVGRAVSRDPVLALHVLRLANSDSYGRPREAASLESALAALGPAQVRRICVMAATARNAAFSLADIGRLEPLLRHHCRATALASRRLTEPFSPGFRREAFTACLLHGIGEAAAGTLPAGRAGTGREDAGELGAFLLQQWKFPERLVQAVRFHRAGADDESAEPSLAEVVGAACGIAQLLGVPCPSDPEGFGLSARALKVLDESSPSDELILTILADLRTAGLLEDAPGPTLGARGSP